MPSAKDNKRDYEEHYKEASTAWSQWKEIARSDLKAVLSDAYTSKDTQKLKQLGLEPLSVPLIMRNLRLITGYQSKNRLSIRYDPIENTDIQGSQDLTELVGWHLNRYGGYQVISKAFEGALKTGLNLVNVHYKQSRGVKSVHLKRYPYNSFVLDPVFTEQDLSDCNYLIVRTKVSKEQLYKLFPDRKSEIDGIVRSLSDRTNQGSDDGKFYDMSFDVPHQTRGVLSLDEYQRRVTRPCKYIVNTMTGQPMKDVSGAPVKWEGSQQDLNLILMQFPFLDTKTEYEDTVEVIHYLNGEQLSQAYDPWGIGDFSFTPVFCFWDPEAEQMHLRCRSMVRALKPTQRISDKRIMAMLAYFEQQIGTGLDYEVNTLEDEEDAFAAGPGRPRKFKRNALNENRVRDRQVPDMPAGMIQLFELFSKLMPESVNINDEMFGITNDKMQIAGVLAKLRQGAGLTGSADIFDNLSNSQKGIGRKLAKLMHAITPERMTRILGREPSPTIFRDDIDYDCVAVEGIETDTQRNLFYSELLNLKEVGAKIGDPAPIPWSFILKYAPVAIKSDLIKAVQQYEQGQQQQQARQQQLSDTMQALAVEQSRATIASEHAQNIERQAQAVENRAGAALDRVKAASEIDDLRNKNIIELLKMVKDIEIAQAKGNNR